MKVIYFFIGIFFIAVCGACCKKSSTDLQKPEMTLENLLEEIYGTQGKIIKNESESLAILLKESKKFNGQEFPGIEFTLVAISTLEKTYSGKASFANITWEDDLNVKIVVYPDQIPNPDEPPLFPKYYTINAMTGKKTTQL